MRTLTLVLSLLMLSLGLVACGDDDDGNEADRFGVGAECVQDEDCNPDQNLRCINDFKGGYCGLEGCMTNADCPEGSACVDNGGANYCFRLCQDKGECNRNRSADNESNCASNVTFVEPSTAGKACVPPSN